MMNVAARPSPWYRYPISFARLLLQVSLSLEHGHLAMELIKLCRFLRGFIAGLSFQGLDFVIPEARKYGIRLILTLRNNHHDFGGRRS
ncbi:hypothetical protein POPTR_013G098625v4 [Populus trichocarpa]|uniref:Uncharacterized protein n=1 Tax=Populus trichocarpa TaxID=3694 RepID=A0ACC0S3S6_POPTR|nr:hypothetical protein POPTR_013G098625v4 [Populus trichocarpa]